MYLDVVWRRDGSLGTIDGETSQVNQERGLIVIEAPEVGLLAVLAVYRRVAAAPRLRRAGKPATDGNLTAAMMDEIESERLPLDAGSEAGQSGLRR